jgi:hypothetical protein
VQLEAAPGRRIDQHHAVGLDPSRPVEAWQEALLGQLQIAQQCAGGGEFGAVLVRRTDALWKAATTNDPDAAATAGGQWAAMVFGAESFGTPVPRPARVAKLRTQSQRFLHDVKVLGGYQLGDDAMLMVEAKDGAGWTARGPILVSRQDGEMDVAGDLTIAYPPQ